MNKLNSIIFFIFFISIQLNAQSMSQKGIIEYNYIFLFDTIGRTVGNETESFLYFDIEKQQSVYVWDRKSKAKTKELVKTPNGMMYFKIKNGGSDPIGNLIFKDYKNNNIVERKLGQTIQIISDNYDINWQINDETKTKNDMVLQKAECDFRGRHYIAWFNPKIPIPDGPWKLRGLPGLIIEAYDEKKHVQFNFTSLTLPAEFNEKIEAPTIGKHLIYDCAQFTAAHYEMIRELTKGVVAKVQQSSGTMQGHGNINTNTMERCY